MLSSLARGLGVNTSVVRPWAGRLLAQRRGILSKVGVHLPCVTVAPPLAVTETKNWCYCVDHISCWVGWLHATGRRTRGSRSRQEDKEATTGRRHPTWKSLTILSEAFRLALPGLLVLALPGLLVLAGVSLRRQWWRCRLHSRKSRYGVVGSVESAEPPR